MLTGQYIGIDFGTTNTAVVYVQYNEDGRKIICLGENGQFPFSSIVAIPKNSESPLIFGRKVREQRLQLAETHEVYTSMKPFLGKKTASGEPVSFVVGGKRYYPGDITAAFLRHIKDYVKRNFDIGSDIDAASFSFPVDFTPEARRELRKAAEQAGIKVMACVSESTAAYIANRAEGRAFSKVMVLDWGGGTLDISVLKLTGTSIHEISVGGGHIGGDDIDRELAERVHSRIAAESGIPGGRFEDMQPAEKDQMIMRCEEAKISISDNGEDYPLTVRNYGAYGTKNTTITEEQFDGIVEPLIKTRVLKAINDTLAKAGGISPASIDAIIIVGGSSNLRLFERAVMNLFKDAKIIIPENVQWSVATGAALMQIVGGNFQLSDDVCVLLSDETVFPVLRQGHTAAHPIKPISFSLTEDAKDAHFIFTDSTGKNVYTKQNVPTKGFLKETLELSATIGDDQMARIEITNKNFGEPKKTTIVELNKLTFHYDIGALGNTD
ncbi:MAG: Hsp70 family protein [Synergistaceae bacterium]|jgi:molecular chaperone DnaK|nr:Hsp70 family protein [Synergistaceae bacterium]